MNPHPTTTFRGCYIGQIWRERSFSPRRTADAVRVGGSTGVGVGPTVEGIAGRRGTDCPSSFAREIAGTVGYSTNNIQLLGSNRLGREEPGSIWDYVLG